MASMARSRSSRGSTAPHDEDVIKESIGAFPRVVLSEGEYRAIAKNEGKVFERPFNVVNGVDGEVEVVAR